MSQFYTHADKYRISNRGLNRGDVANDLIIWASSFLHQLVNKIIHLFNIPYTLSANGDLDEEDVIMSIQKAGTLKILSH